jgi:hypothetical protein
MPNIDRRGRARSRALRVNAQGELAGYPDRRVIPGRAPEVDLRGTDSPRSGVSGIWPISATVLGSYPPSFRGGGSGLGSQAAEPFAIGCSAVTQRGPWVR